MLDALLQWLQLIVLNQPAHLLDFQLRDSVLLFFFLQLPAQLVQPLFRSLDLLLPSTHLLPVAFLLLKDLGLELSLLAFKPGQILLLCLGVFLRL